MTNGRFTPSPATLARLFDGSALVSLTDGELLARFVATRDEAAFEGLVARLGPMVLGVCRRMLGDRADADDAFQATFLVLVRRARSVGRGDLIGPWLHGVAVRVCRKARAQAARRRAREQTGIGVDHFVLAPAPAVATILDHAETRATIDAEIARLPESYRRLVILCDVEGFTRDEVADRLGWTPNMVRGRIARARAHLRANLARRGCTPPSRAGLPDWTGLPWLIIPPPPCIATTARAALASLSPPGRGTLALTSALTLAQGVSRTMFLTSGKFIAATMLTASTLAAGTAGVLMAQNPAPVPAVVQPPDPTPRAAPDPIPPPATALKTLLEERLRTAQKRLEAQQAYYQEGRITIDRLIDASHGAMRAKMGLAETPEQRQAAIQTHLDQVKEILDKESEEFEAGRATADDLAAAAEALNDARILQAMELAKGSTQFDVNIAAPLGPSRKRPSNRNQVEAPAAPTNPTAAASKTIADLNQARVELARQLFADAERLYPGELPAEDYLKAHRDLLDAELDAATTRAGRAAAFRSLIEVAQKLVATTEGLARLGVKKPKDVMKTKMDLLELQAHAAKDAAVDADPVTVNLDRRMTEVERKVDRILEALSNNPGKREQ